MDKPTTNKMIMPLIIIICLCVCVVSILAILGITGSGVTAGIGEAKLNKLEDRVNNISKMLSGGIAMQMSTVDPNASNAIPTYIGPCSAGPTACADTDITSPKYLTTGQKNGTAIYFSAYSKPSS